MAEVHISITALKWDSAKEFLPQKSNFQPHQTNNPKAPLPGAVLTAAPGYFFAQKVISNIIF